jgi:hypothetical protein
MVISICIISFVILLLMVFFPGGADLYIYSIGGKMMLSGLTPYKDFIDSKPPGIFALYAFIHGVFGNDINTIRIFDILYHCLSLSFFYILIKRFTSSTSIALLSLPIYTLWYVSMGIWDTVQSESFALLPTLVIVASVQYSFVNSFDRKKAIFLGILCGLSCIALVSLKFTLIYVLACALFVLVWKHPSRRYSITLGITSVVVVGLSVVVFYQWLQSSGAYENFALMMQWLQGYSDNHPFSDYRTFNFVLFVRFAQTLLTLYSPTFIILGVAGILASMKSRNRSDAKPVVNVDNVFRSQLLLQLAVGLLTIILERKNIRYHFARSFWAFTPFIAMGVISIFVFGKQLWGQYQYKDLIARLAGRIAVGVLVVMALAGTPLFKVATEAGSYAIHTLTGYETTAYVEYSNIGSESQLLELEDYLRTNLREGESFFFWGSIIGPHAVLNVFPPTIMMANLQIATPWTPKELRNTVLRQLGEKRPRYFIVQTGDYMPDLSATTNDSFGLLIDWYELFEFLDMNYEEKHMLDNFIIYEYSAQKAAESAAF